MLKLLTLVSFITLFAFQAEANFCGDILGFFKRSKEPSFAFEQIERYKVILHQLERRRPQDVDPSFNQMWSYHPDRCATTSCIPISAQLREALIKRKMPALQVTVDSLGKLDNPELPDGAYHAFLVDISDPSKEIIIDPTYKQFFHGNIKGPPIFVGTRNQLEKFFAQNAKYIKLQNLKDSRKDLDSAAIVETIYGYGRGEIMSFGETSRVKTVIKPTQDPRAYRYQYESGIL